MMTNPPTTPEPPVEPARPSFEVALAALLNHYSRETESGTPDFILATYLNDCLAAFSVATRERTRWYNQSGTELGVPETRTEPAR